MIYNFYFEITAMILMLLIILDGSSKKYQAGWDIRWFRLALFSQMINSGLNICSCVLLRYGLKIPYGINMLVLVLFFIAQGLTIFFLNAYAICLCARKRKNRLIFGFPVLFMCLVNVIISIGTIWTHAYFYIDRLGNYHQGYMAEVGYLYYVAGVLYALLIIILCHKNLVKTEFFVMILQCLMICIGVIFQLMFRNILTIGLAVAVSLFLIYSRLENKNKYRDKLTGCFNEEAFKELMIRKTGNHEKFSVIILDIQKFRFVNSMHGYYGGDYLLRSIGKYFNEELKQGETYRVFGHSFVVVLEQDEEKTHEVATQIFERFQKPWLMNDDKEITLETGVAALDSPKHFNSYTSLLEMYKFLKNVARKHMNKAVIYANDKDCEKCARKEQVEKALRYALDHHKLQVYYQPIVDCETLQAISLEALCRLYDEENGWISPAEFIPVAEETGLILALGVQVFEQVCQFISNDLIHLKNNPVTMVEVNLSPIQCMHRQIIQKMMMLMDEYQIPPEMINFEITESATAEEQKMMKKAMQALIDYGCSFSLDDYGTGYSNISYLIQFPFKRVKFDRQLVVSYFEDAQAKTIMKKEFELIHVIGKEIVAEGIETEEQKKTLEKEGIRYHQGFYYSKPVPKEQCMEFILKQAEDIEKNKDL